MNALANISQFGALSILFGILVIGELAARLSNGKIPGALVMSFALLVGFWTIFPLDLVERAGITNLVYALCAMATVVNLATLINRKEMIAQWKTVVISLMGIAGICLFVLTIGAKIFGFDNAVAATPPLTGGAIATIIMQEAAMAKGKTAAALVAIIAMVMQGLAGYPLTSIFLTKEAKRLEREFKAGTLKLDTGSGNEDLTAAKETIFTKIKSPAYILFKIIIVAYLSYLMEIMITNISGGSVLISRYVWCLVLGFIASEVGVLEKDALAVAKSDGLTMNLLLLYLFGSLSTATIELFLPVAGVTLGLIAISTVGMALMALVASKVFKSETFAMCFCIILTAYYGFPINVMLTHEAIDGTTKDPETKKMLTSVLLPKMLIGGFTSVTIVSIVVAGVLVKYL